MKLVAEPAVLRALVGLARDRARYAHELRFAGRQPYPSEEGELGLWLVLDASLEALERGELNAHQLKLLQQERARKPEKEQAQ